MNSHLFIIHGAAVDLAAECPTVTHILGPDPFGLAPSWVTDIRKNEYLGLCWCDADIRNFACINVSAEVEAMLESKPYDERSAFGDVVATRLVNNE